MGYHCTYIVWAYLGLISERAGKREYGPNLQLKSHVYSLLVLLSVMDLDLNPAHPDFKTTVRYWFSGQGQRQPLTWLSRLRNFRRVWTAVFCHRQKLCSFSLSAICSWFCPPWPSHSNRSHKESNLITVYEHFGKFLSPEFLENSWVPTSTVLNP
jgi:hypothetical protein